MRKRILIILLASCILSIPASFTLAADQEAPRESVQATTHEHAQAQDKNQEQIYGSQLMTQQERDEYQTRMHSAKSKEEQEQIRKVHHELMQARAKERGMSLPDMMPMHKDGMGSGGGMGSGHR